MDLLLTAVIAFLIGYQCGVPNGFKEAMKEYRDEWIEIGRVKGILEILEEETENK